MSAGGGRARWMVAVLVVLVLVISWGGYEWLRSPTPTKSQDELAGTLQREDAAADEFKPPPVSAVVSNPELVPVPTDPLAVGADARPAMLIRVTDERGVRMKAVQVDAFTEPDTGVWYQRYTDSNGQASLECPPGAYAVSANHADETALYGHGFKVVEVAEGGTTIVELRLPDLTAQVDVVVQDDRGVPIEGAVVSVSGLLARRHERNKTTDEHGAVKWAPIAEGNRHFRVTSADARFDVRNTEWTRVSVGRGEVEQVTLELSRMGRVVVNRAEVPHLEDLVQLTLVTEDDTDRERAPWKDEQIVWHVPPGDAELSAEWSADVDAWSRPQMLTVLPGEDTVARVRVEVGATVLTGRVVDAADVPVEGVSIGATVIEYLTSSQTNRSWRLLARKTATSDTSGHFTILGLPDGEVHGSVNVATASGRHLAGYRSNYGDSPGFTVDYPWLPLDIVVVPGVMLEGTVNEPWATRWADGEVYLQVVQEQPAGGVRYKRHRPRLRDDRGFSLGHLFPGLYSAVMTDGRDESTEPLLFVIPEGLAEGAVTTQHLAFPR